MTSPFTLRADSDDYRYQGGRVCGNKPVRADYLDTVVWDHITSLLADPVLIRAEISKRLETARTSDPVTRQRNRLELEAAKAASSITAMIEAFSEQLLTIDELRARMPHLRARQANLRTQIDALDAQAADRDAYLKLADDLQGFLTQLRGKAATADVEERQRVLRLLVKDVLVGPEKITIRHRIPLRERTSHGNQEPDTEGDPSASCPLRWGRGRAALRSPGHLPPHLPVFHHPGAQHHPQEFQDALVADAFLDRLHQLVMRNRRKAVGDVRLDHPPPPLPALIDEHLQAIVR
jgi:site-specific DNA recombinase